MNKLRCTSFYFVFVISCCRYDVKIKPSVGINSIVTSQETRQTLTRHLLSYNFWALTGK